MTIVPTFRERIDKIIDYLNITRAEFERRAGLSNGYTRNLGGIPGADKLEAILTSFPMISRSWLMTGTGEMILGAITTAKDISSNTSFSELLAIIRSQQETIQELVKRLSPQ